MVFEVGWSESCGNTNPIHALSMAVGAEMAESWAIHAVEAPDSIGYTFGGNSQRTIDPGQDHKNPVQRQRGWFIYMVSFKMQQRHLVVSSFFATLTSGLLVS